MKKKINKSECIGLGHETIHIRMMERIIQKSDLLTNPKSQRIRFLISPEWDVTIAAVE